MNFRKTLMAATIAALPLLTCSQAAAGALMGAMAVQSPQDKARLVAQLVSQRGKHGLDSRHDFKLAQQHPGAEGTIISRADHTFKGVRIFHSESVVVTGPHGSIISESVSDRRSGLKQKDLNVTPAISAGSAIDKVVRAVAPGGKHVQQPSAELIIYPLVTEGAAGAVQGRGRTQRDGPRRAGHRLRAGLAGADPHGGRRHPSVLLRYRGQRQ
jgi:Zn-dependent metalloprotease